MTGYFWRSLVAALVLLGAGGLAYALRPVPVIDVRDVSLERQIPANFGQWREARASLIQIDLTPRGENGAPEASVQWPYDESLMRTYVRDDGQVVMLAIAWGSKQRQEIRVHRPELCYAGQGLEVLERKDVELNLGQGKPIIATRLLTRNLSRTEPVTYWMRVGDRTGLNAWQMRLQIMKEGVRGRIPDGILVRVSQGLSSAHLTAASYQIQEEFLGAMLAAVDPSTRRLLVR